MRASWIKRAAGGLGVTALLATASMAPAGSQSVSEPLAEGLLGPLGVAVDDADGAVYVSQAFAEPSVLTALFEGDVFDAAEAPVAGASITGVDARDGEIAFTVGNPEIAFGELRRVTGPTSELVFDTAAFEAAENPDQINSYGFQGLSPACAAEVALALPDDPGGGLPYNGVVDSNPYGVLGVGAGIWVIADAGGNDLIVVDDEGTLLDVLVLPPVPLFIPPGTPGIPECAWGSSYNFEPVPTDVEIGPDDTIYVTGLPGGPEDPSFGARGVVFAIDPITAAIEVVASGFAGATGLAVTPDGTIYVAELFGGRISKVVNGAPETFVEVEGPAALEYFDGMLFATIRAVPFDGPPNGAVVTISLPEPPPPPPTTPTTPTTTSRPTTTTAGAQPVAARPAFTG